MNYIAYTFVIKDHTSGTLPLQTAIEILIAQLGAVGFESFTEQEKGVIAYIQEQDWNPEMLTHIQILDSNDVQISYTKENIQQINWNSEWEKHFEPIEVDGLIGVRAPFHKNPELKYDIVIEPKMSFGTGHHETTHLMLQHLLYMDLKNKSVLDMGCGTGILAIFAHMKGAQPIDAIDIDAWCYENTLENIDKNHCSNINAYQGDASLLKEQKYDVIIANINRNILINDIPHYTRCLEKNGQLLLSGFYSEDIPVIKKSLDQHQLVIEQQLLKNNWVALRCINNS